MGPGHGLHDARQSPQGNQDRDRRQHQVRWSRAGDRAETRTEIAISCQLSAVRIAQVLYRRLSINSARPILSPVLGKGGPSPQTPRPAPLRNAGPVAEERKQSSERRQRRPWLAPGIRPQRLEVISAEKRRRVLDVHQAHAAPHLLYRDILVLFHPALHACQHHADVLDAVLQQRRCHHGHVRARHHGLQHVAGIMHPTGDGDVGLDLVIQNGGPMEPEAQLMRAAQHQVRYYLQLLQVEVGLVETIKDHDAVGAGFGQTLDEVGARREVRPQLYRNRDMYTLADGAYQVTIAVFQRRRRERWIAGNVEDVQLQRVGARLLHELGVADPSARRAAIEAGDDRNAYGGFALAQQFQIAIGADMIILHVRQIGGGFGVAVDAVLQRAVYVFALRLDLFFKQRIHHDGRGPGVFQTVKVLQLLRQR